MGSKEERVCKGNVQWEGARGRGEEVMQQWKGARWQGEQGGEGEGARE